MLKGFIDYRNAKIPFAISDYRMEVFTDDEMLAEFAREHNRKNNYILHGECFRMGTTSQKITFLVESSIGTTLFLKCYLINNISKENDFDSINFQSKELDSIFQYKYNYIDLSHSGVNLSNGQKDVYNLPFLIDSKDYALTYKIGQNISLGLFEDFERWGETSINLYSTEIIECYKITTLIQRLMIFLTSNTDVYFKKIVLKKDGIIKGHFFCKSVSDATSDAYDIHFYDFNVEKYIPHLLDNLALNLDNKITKSICLGHINNFKSKYTPHRFIEQVMAFEYLFEKLEPKKADDSEFPLKKELEYMFDIYAEKIALNDTAFNISTRIKKLRVNITHGYEFYYDFTDSRDIMYLIIKLDELLICMNLQLAGFSKDEILAFKPFN